MVSHCALVSGELRSSNPPDPWSLATRSSTSPSLPGSTRLRSSALCGQRRMAFSTSSRSSRPMSAPSTSRPRPTCSELLVRTLALTVFCLRAVFLLGGLMRHDGTGTAARRKCSKETGPAAATTGASGSRWTSASRGRGKPLRTSGCSWTG